jgi:hypothetical protein
VAFSTVFQAFLTTFLIDSGYKTPIQNMDELFASGIKLAYLPNYGFIFDSGDETEASKILRNKVYCPSFGICISWAKYQRSVSILMNDYFVDHNYANGFLVGENFETFVC